MKLGKLGIFAPMDTPIHHFGDPSPGPASSADAARFARHVEALGYAAVWSPEGFGRNPLVLSSWLLANTTRLTVATGIASIYSRDAMATAAAQKGLAEQSGGRFLLGLGVSHAPVVEGTRGHSYTSPVAAMRSYVAAMAQAPYVAVQPAERPPLVLAALRDRMLALSAEIADGAHPYNVTPEHTARARAILGPGKLLCPEQKLVLETDPARARAAARGTLKLYMGLENYRNAWKTMGFSDEDMAGQGSDRLVDAMVAWGDAAALRDRVQAHFDAGADHVVIHPVAAGGGIDMRVLEALAPGA